jgi:hypothetical protein
MIFEGLGIIGTQKIKMGCVSSGGNRLCRPLVDTTTDMYSKQ